MAVIDNLDGYRMYIITFEIYEEDFRHFISYVSNWNLGLH